MAIFDKNFQGSSVDSIVRSITDEICPTKGGANGLDSIVVG